MTWLAHFLFLTFSSFLFHHPCLVCNIMLVYLSAYPCAWSPDSSSLNWYPLTPSEHIWDNCFFSAIFLQWGNFFSHFLKAMVKWMTVVRVLHFVKFCYPFSIFPRARRRWGNFWFTNEGFPLPLPQIQIASCNAATLSSSGWVGSWQKLCLLCVLDPCWKQG